MAIDYGRIKSLETKKTPRLRRTITFLPLIVMVEMETKASHVKLWIGLPRKIFAHIKETNEANLLIP